jgi:hypothetical protein
MGISDEAYGDALIKQKAYVEQQMKEQVKMLKEHHTTIGKGTGTVIVSTPSATTTFTGSGAYIGNTTTGTFTPTGLKLITEANLHHDAMKAPLSALVDMWTMRWQGMWVNESEFDEDDFWRLALVRLLGASKLEKHNLADQHRSVYRIIE